MSVNGQEALKKNTVILEFIFQIYFLVWLIFSSIRCGFQTKCVFPLSRVSVILKFQVPLKTWTCWLNFLRRFWLEVRILKTATKKSLLHHFEFLCGIRAEMMEKHSKSQFRVHLFSTWTTVILVSLNGNFCRIVVCQKLSF